MLLHHAGSKSNFLNCIFYSTNVVSALGLRWRRMATQTKLEHSAQILISPVSGGFKNQPIRKRLQTRAVWGGFFGKDIWSENPSDFSWICLPLAAAAGLLNKVKVCEQSQDKCARVEQAFPNFLSFRGLAGSVSKCEFCQSSPFRVVTLLVDGKNSTQTNKQTNCLETFLSRQPKCSAVSQTTSGKAVWGQLWLLQGHDYCMYLCAPPPCDDSNCSTPHPSQCCPCKSVFLNLQVLQ